MTFINFPVLQKIISNNIKRIDHTGYLFVVGVFYRNEKGRGPVLSIMYLKEHITKVEYQLESLQHSKQLLDILKTKINQSFNIIDFEIEIYMNV